MYKDYIRSLRKTRFWYQAVILIILLTALGMNFSGQYVTAFPFKFIAFYHIVKKAFPSKNTSLLGIGFLEINTDFGGVLCCGVVGMACTQLCRTTYNLF